MTEMHTWLAQVSRDLDLPDDLSTAVSGPILDLVRDIAHGVNRPSGPMTAYLVGVLAGAAGARAVDARGSGTPTPSDPVDPGTAAEVTVATAERIRAMVAAHQDG